MRVMESGDVNSDFGAMADTIGIPKDMLIFFLGEALCLVAAILYHHFLPPRLSSSRLRHSVALVLGIMVGFLSFGREFFHVIIQSALSYVFIQILPSSIVHMVVFVLAMSYLVCLHLYRAFVIPEDVLYSIDVSGPLMIVTQKITSIAFGLYDGCHGNKDELSDLQKRYMISKPPSTLEYFSYIFHFQGVVVGPLCFYPDYKAYVEGSNIRDSGTSLKMNGNNNNHQLLSPPSPYGTVVKKMAITAFWMSFHFTLKPLFPEMKNSDPAFINYHGYLYRLWYMLFSMLCCRAKYYAAFSLGDAICNASGLGFNGYNLNGHAKWDLVTNVHISGIECATSPKSYIDNWNIQTALWLRLVCHDRLAYNRVFATFLLSAMWHGCYPGYYFTFLSGAMFITVSRQLRRRVRPYFLGSPSIKLFYDVLTWMTTHLVLSYMAVPFTILHFWTTITFYNSMYWALHIISILALLTLPYIPVHEHQSQDKQKIGSADINNGKSRTHVSVMN